MSKTVCYRLKDSTEVLTVTIPNEQDSVTFLLGMHPNDVFRISKIVYNDEE